ncbi:putative sensor protein QseC [Pasteurella bettyae CCUG 2042]|uniref:histidine kinase n=2 Tax=Pasteurella bettyae TaxID=752 RepID=I3DEL4_9PAST|nr:putative sensor protein QseC [Pasteurella bettyae CCUG 2042]SUB21948.1 sensor protein QseC [Pasteurella bettyae]
MRYMKSIRFRLIIILSLVSLIIRGIIGYFTWDYVHIEINHIFDSRQILLAKRLASSSLQQILYEKQNSLISPAGGFVDQSSLQGVPSKQYDDDALAFAIFTRYGEKVVSDDANGEYLSFQPAQGFSTAKLTNSDEEWRIFWLPSKDKELLIAVGQQIEYRDRLINKFVWDQLLVWILTFLIMLGFIVWIITREFSLLKQLSENLKKRKPDDNTLISTQNMPTEVLPLVNGLNSYIARSAKTLIRERRFTSDAAHELRSPLAGLKVQTELVQMLNDEPELQQEALNNLNEGISRMTNLVEQLLTLSRLDNLDELDELENINWEELIEHVLRTQSAYAAKRNMQLSFDKQSIPLQKQGQPLLLSLMLGNLLDNAIKYCSERSFIRIILTKNAVIIEDNGGGVSDEEIQKLGQRFYRPAGQNEKGSGLGISIVYCIAELHGYSILALSFEKFLNISPHFLFI